MTRKTGNDLVFTFYSLFLWTCSIFCFYKPECAFTSSQKLPRLTLLRSSYIVRWEARFHRFKSGSHYSLFSFPRPPVILVSSVLKNHPQSWFLFSQIPGRKDQLHCRVHFCCVSSCVNPAGSISTPRFTCGFVLTSISAADPSLPFPAVRSSPAPLMAISLLLLTGIQKCHHCVLLELLHSSDRTCWSLC